MLSRLKNAWTIFKLSWATLSRWQKLVAIWLLVFYIAMIGVTVATAPYSDATRNDQTVPRALN